MTALHLHNSLFTGEKEFDQPFHSIEPLLIPASRRFSPISPSFNSPAFQDLIARQPTHPDGPRAGWDLGLNLLGDPPTAAEYKSVEEHSVKNKLRRLHRAAVAFEFVFGMDVFVRLHVRSSSRDALSAGLWGVYTVIRYFLAFATVSHHAQRVFSLALGIASAVAVAATIVSVTLPLFYGSTCVHSCRQIRTLLRACYLLLILSVSATNLALVATWRPKDRCVWDIDVSWYLSALNSTTRCEPATFALWIIAAVLRLFLTSLLIVGLRCANSMINVIYVCNRFCLCTSFVRTALPDTLPRRRSKNGVDHIDPQYPYQMSRTFRPPIHSSVQRHHF